MTYESILALYNAKAEAAGHATGDRVCEWRSAIARAIVARDALALRVLANGVNPTGLALFCEVAGIKIPRTQRDQWAAIMAFCDYTPEQEAARVATETAKREARAAARDLEWSRRAAEGMRIRTEAGTVTGREWLDSAIADGFNTLRARKRGAVTVYDLVKPGSSTFFQLTGKGWKAVSDYARALLPVTVDNRQWG